MSKRHRGRYERRERDFYATPLASVRPLMPHLRAARAVEFCEPCAGEGDLVRNLASFGLRCAYQGDIATGQDALAISHFEAPPITNPPYRRDLLMPLIKHFLASASFFWLLLPADFAHVAYAQEVMRYCTDIVPAGRAKWFGGSGSENIAWYRFSTDRHAAAPIFHNGDSAVVAANHTMRCETCGQVFHRVRTDAVYCSSGCRQRAYRNRRSAVTVL